MNDQIFINALELELKIGCTAEERIEAQRVELDATIDVFSSTAAKTKDLTDTVCYLTLSNLYKEITETSEWVLIEELLESLANESLSRYSAIQAIRLEARKFVVPNTKSVGVRIFRDRNV